ncbi:MAG TPA: hypothetical protein VEC99_11875, partial [Clostridia bacterium]|nr:hypothetical protein [Clostridia bacterium]
VLQIVFGRIEGKISNVNLGAHVIFDVLSVTLFFSNCSRLSGFKSSLNEVHLRFTMSWKRQASY